MTAVFNPEVTVAILLQRIRCEDLSVKVVLNNPKLDCRTIIFHLLC